MSRLEQLANATKTVPQMSSITRGGWCISLNWVPVEAGIYRVNRVKDEDAVEVAPARCVTSALCPILTCDYIDNPREYMLSAVNTVLDIHTRVSDLYSVPHNQIKEQLRLTIEIDQGEPGKRAHQQQGLWPPGQRCRSAEDQDATGAPTPDDLDELIAQACGRSRHSS